ncbi:protein rolling stone-like [Macrosteles quadrilineatus]|uniref:protein rolling stone-like n=1 Tax=Macrosteles quadrilineatus TaxID=74068 RepID=UPI0023E28064|nr:protein rolling stone-like [Macrosteles quadrilineatus]
MVLQITAWRQKISSKVMDMNHYTPDMLVKSQWQRTPGISIYYLVYRWVIASVFFSILLASLVELGRPGGMGAVHYAKWIIYLTHWGFTACTLQALLAAYLVTKAHCRHPDEETDAMKMCLSLKIYWILHSVATVGAFAITAIYWGFVFDPAENKLDTLNILVHAGNSVLMLTDLIIIAHPIRLVDFYWPLAFALSYVSFNYVYFLAGGTDRKGRSYVYKILDWRKPVTTLVVIQCCLLLVIIVHVLVSFSCVLRCKIFQALRRREEERREDRTRNLQGATNEIPINDLV